MSHRLHRAVVGGPLGRARRRQTRSRPAAGRASRCARRTSSSCAKPTGSSSCSRRRSTAPRTIPDTSGRTRRAFARTAASTRTRRRGSAGRTPGWATESAPSASSASSIRCFALARAEECERYRVEPYVLAGDVYGAPPWVGRGGWTWYTGAAAWTWRLGVEGILGLRKEEGGLRIDPVHPTDLEGIRSVGSNRDSATSRRRRESGRREPGRREHHARWQIARFELDPARTGRHRRRTAAARGLRASRQNPQRRDRDHGHTECTVVENGGEREP